MEETMIPVEEMRKLAAEAGAALAAAYLRDDLSSFHLQLGRAWAVAGMIYDANAREEILRGRV